MPLSSSCKQFDIRMLNKIVNFFTSLRLTVVCLGLALLLVFIGTLAQVNEGLYAAQNRYFRSFFVYWSPPGADWGLPVFPGGYLLGGLLLVNLIAAHIKRFTFTKKKIGIFFIHAGLILLLLGQLSTDLLQVESHMRLVEGQTKNYSESGLQNELAVIDTSNPQSDFVIALPESLLARESEIKHPQLPFTIRVKNFLPNSEPRLRAPMADTEPPQATQGIGQRMELRPLPLTAKMDARNIPGAVIEIMTPQGSQGTWLVSNWTAEEILVGSLQRQWGGRFAAFLDSPQQFTYQGHTYQLALRPARYYKPYSVQLLEFRHDKYKGTEKPKNFSSRIRLLWPEKRVDREVKIYMNNPLRYEGETYYQASFDELDPRVTILQVVRNPGWLTPYLACAIVALGLVIQFLSHLISFAKKSSGAGKTDSTRKRSASRSGPKAEVVLPVAASGIDAASSFQAAAKRRSA
jgi:hypothetical protein